MSLWKFLPSTMLLLSLCTAPLRAVDPVSTTVYPSTSTTVYPSTSVYAGSGDVVYDNGYGNGYGYGYDCGSGCFDFCRGWTVYADFLYWKVVQDGLQFAIDLPGGLQPLVQAFSTTPVRIEERLSIIDQSFDFDPGFRVGLGYEFACSCWDFKVYWTHIDDKTSTRVRSRADGIFPLTIPVGAIFGFINSDPEDFALGDFARSRWHFEYDTIDLEFGRTSCCDCFAVRPFVGVKFARIGQNQHINYFGFTFGEEVPVFLRNRKKNDFHGVGPSFGFDASWAFCNNLSISGGLTGALLVGKFRAHERPFVAFDDTFAEFNLKHDKKHRIRPMVDANIGLDWCGCFCGLPILVGVHYEMRYWWNQWQVSPSLLGAFVNGGSSPQGDLMMHGLTVKFGVSF